jgi:hypothetical protein
VKFWRSVDPAQAPPSSQRWILALFALGVMVLVLWFFSPRYVLWPTVNFPEFNTFPDTNRAYFTLLQLNDPFLQVDHLSNQVIEWRLLFPLIFHYLHLPAGLFLALPWIGCLLVLWYGAMLLWQRTHDRVLTAGGLVILGTLSWFFTSTGWLTYFDSWYVLAGLIIAFSPSLWLVLAAAAFTPWIDERIVFMLPVCLAARLALAWQDSGRLLPDRRMWRVMAAAVAPIAAYALIRLAATIWFDDGSRTYVNYHATRADIFEGMIAGTWYGVRLAWLPLLALPVLLARRSRTLAIGIGATIAVCTVIALVIAADISRSMSMLTPLIVAALILLPRLHANAKAIVVAVAAGNLLLPAAHIIGGYTIPIFDARYELDHFRFPPEHLDPRFHLAQAMSQYRAGQLEGTVRSLNYAKRTTRLPNELASAITEFGLLEEQKGQLGNAAAFYVEALATGSGDWPERASVENKLQRLKASGVR